MLTLKKDDGEIVAVLPSRVVWVTPAGPDLTLVQLEEGKPFSAQGEYLDIVASIDAALQ